MQLFYNPNISENDSDFSFDKDESRHIIKVLRKSLGDKLHITNGLGWLFLAELFDTNPKSCKARIIEKQLQNKRAYHLHLAVAPTKMNDRYEWFLEKATEIGVDEITPIISDNSERKIVKIERYNKILLSAMKQSLQCFLPKLNTPLAFNDFIDKNHKAHKFIAHCHEGDRDTLITQIEPNGNYIIVIGPEGDFSDQEVSGALDLGYKPVSLGKTRLRTETAAIAACHTVAVTHEL